MVQSDLIFHAGEPTRLVVILIHGFGVNRYFWENAESCLVFGGLFPLTVFLSKAPVDNHRSIISTGVPNPALVGLFQRLHDNGFSIASWSQQQPLGPISYALAELQEVYKKVKEKWPRRPIFLIGHSRGGLVAKKFLKDFGDQGIDGLITLATPFEGTNIAGFSVFLRPVADILEKVLPNSSQSKMMNAFNRLAIYLKSSATRELLPGSELIASLKGEQLSGRLKKLSFGGTDPSFFKLYVRSLAGEDWNVISFPELLLKAVPDSRLPNEIKPGVGDGLVTAQSAILKGGEHLNIQTNHVGIAYDKGVQDSIIKFLET